MNCPSSAIAIFPNLFSKPYVTLLSGDSASVNCIISDTFSSNGGTSWKNTVIGDVNHGRTLCFHGSSKDIKKYVEYMSKRKKEGIAEMISTTAEGYANGWASAMHKTWHTYESPRVIPFIPKVISNPFPNPPPRRQNKMDICCRENLAFLRLIYTRLGLAQFPGQLPNTIIQEIPKEGEEPAEPPQVPIPDLVSLLNWTFERDDERWGQWAVQINVKDSDITKEGDQGKQVKFPNLAESIAEIEGQILSLSTNMDGLVAITTKNLVESGLGRQEAIKSYLAAKAIIKYMAFKTEEIDVDIPACFTPSAETIHELVKESTIHVKGIDYTEKETLRDIYLDLLQSAAIIRAVHWQRINTNQNTKGQLLQHLKGIAGLASSIKNPTPTGGETQPKRTEDFEDFIDTVEDGFRNVAGIADPENPYGKTPDRRPRIRQIGENISQPGKN